MKGESEDEHGGDERRECRREEDLGASPTQSQHHADDQRRHNLAAAAHPHRPADTGRAERGRIIQRSKRDPTGCRSRQTGRSAPARPTSRPMTSPKSRWRRRRRPKNQSRHQGATAPKRRSTARPAHPDQRAEAVMPSAIAACAGAMPFARSKAATTPPRARARRTPGRTEPTVAAWTRGRREQVLERHAVDAFLVVEVGAGGRTELSDGRCASYLRSPSSARRKRIVRQPDQQRARPRAPHAADQNTAGQPQFVRMKALRNPPTELPRGKADQIRLAIIARRRFGAYSEASARKHGVAPPSPIPATKRTTSSA